MGTDSDLDVVIGHPSGRQSVNDNWKTESEVKPTTVLSTVLPETRSSDDNRFEPRYVRSRKHYKLILLQNKPSKLGDLTFGYFCVFCYFCFGSQLYFYTTTENVSKTTNCKEREAVRNNGSSSKIKVVPPRPITKVVIKGHVKRKWFTLTNRGKNHQGWQTPYRDLVIKIIELPLTFPSGINNRQET